VTREQRVLRPSPFFLFRTDLRRASQIERGLSPGSVLLAGRKAYFFSLGDGDPFQRCPDPRHKIVELASFFFLSSDFSFTGGVVRLPSASD